MPLLIWLGLAISLSGAVAQEERIPSAQSDGVNLNKPAHFQIWRKIALGTYKGVDAYRRVLDSAQIAQVPTVAGPNFFWTPARRIWIDKGAINTGA
jgi:hypothetical protein